MLVDDLIPKLIKASLDNNKKNVEEISLMLIKSYKRKNPDIAKEISEALSFHMNGSSALRSQNMSPIPFDKESRFSLANVVEPTYIDDPVLNEFTYADLEEFIHERERINELLIEDISPPNSLLFIGPPGVGKTYSARWLAYKLQLPLITMDLAGSISSYLGKSGQNIRSLFEFAKSFPCILFLDEFDAIAKKRDDISDTGELKRLVNVLLKELELWPNNSIIIAATNHPDLLDKAIWRRFDKTVYFRLPSKEERKKLIELNLIRYIKIIPKDTLNFFINQTEGINSADLCKLCMHIKRKIILSDQNPSLVVIEAACNTNYTDKSAKIDICKRLKEEFPSLSYRDISKITKIPSSTVNRYIKNMGDSNDE